MLYFIKCNHSVYVMGPLGEAKNHMSSVVLTIFLKCGYDISEDVMRLRVLTYLESTSNR